jgi:hypothetical protein
MYLSVSMFLPCLNKAFLLMSVVPKFFLPFVANILRNALETRAASIVLLHRLILSLPPPTPTQLDLLLLPLTISLSMPPPPLLVLLGSGAEPMQTQDALATAADSPTPAG